MLCKKCKQVRARCRMTSTPIVRHLKQHEKLAKTRIVDQKKKDKKTNNNALLYVASLTHTAKDCTPIPDVVQEYGNNLSRIQRRAIEKRILGPGDLEAKIALCNDLKRIVSKKIDLENAEHKKKQLYKELSELESKSCAVTYHAIEKSGQLENPLSSQISFEEKENKESAQSKENIMKIPIPEVNNTISSVNVP